jgi:AcrR family transcriptional regulator
MAVRQARSGSQATKDRISEAARALFAENGFDRTTVRLVASRAIIHPSLVMRYFDSKEKLFAAVVSFDLRLPDLARHLLKRWEGPDAGGELPALLRIAITHPEGNARLAKIFHEQLEPALAKIVPRKYAARCPALIATQALGLALTRYVLKLPAVTSLPEDHIATFIGETFQRYLEP